MPLPAPLLSVASVHVCVSPRVQSWAERSFSTDRSASRRYRRARKAAETAHAAAVEYCKRKIPSTCLLSDGVSPPPCLCVCVCVALARLNRMYVSSLPLPLRSFASCLPRFVPCHTSSSSLKPRYPTVSSCAPSARPTRLPPLPLHRPRRALIGIDLPPASRAEAEASPLTRMGRLLLESPAVRPRTRAADLRQGRGLAQERRGLRGLVSALRGSACLRPTVRWWT